MEFPKVALELRVPETMNEVIEEVGADYIQGLGKYFKENSCLAARTFLNLSKNFSLISKLSGWYELGGLSKTPSVPLLKKLSSSKSNKYYLRVKGDLHLGKLKPGDLKDLIYQDTFKSEHVYPISLYTFVEDKKGGLKRLDFAEDELKVDFSKERFMTSDYFPAPTLSESYFLSPSDCGMGLKLEQFNQFK